MEKLTKVAAKVLIGFMALVGALNLFLYGVSFFHEDLFQHTGTLQYLVMGLLFSCVAFLLSKMKITHLKKPE